MLVVVWFAVSVTVAVLFGRVIRTRDEREIPRTEKRLGVCASLATTSRSSTGIAASLYATPEGQVRGVNLMMALS